MTAALVTPGCTIGMNLPPLLVASSLSRDDLARGPAGTLLTAESLKLAAAQQKLKALRADVAAAEAKSSAAQIKVTRAEKK